MSRFNISQPVILAFRRFGPYHKARLRASTSHLPVIGLELGTIDDYSWTYESDRFGAPLITLLSGEDPNQASPKRLLTELRRIFAELSPVAVAVPGWSQRCALAVLYACTERSIPTVMMSDSSRDDIKRTVFREWIKTRIVSCFYSSALVAGTRHSDYAIRLGMPSERIETGFDVVDNAHFANSTARALRPGQLISSRSFFLASARFLQRKNLVNLLHAFAAYRKSAGEIAWDLVLLGDGEMRPELESWRAGLGLEQAVLMPGFKQYEQLPAWYRTASCFVHASTSEQWGLVVNEAMAAGLPVLVSNRCGCAPDLVRDGVNGFTFNPYDVGAMTDLMLRMAHGDIDRKGMGRASQQIIENWGPERFAKGLNNAVEIALRVGAMRQNIMDRALLYALLHR